VIVTTASDLADLVAEYRRYDTFVFDLETIYTPTPEEAARFARLDAMTKKQRSPDDQAWYELFRLRPTDPLVNEVIWIGLSTYGRSDCVPVGHPKGELIKPLHKIRRPASEVYSEGDPRLYTPSGAVSKRMIETVVPATYEPPPYQLDPFEALEILRPLYFDTAIRKVNQELKFDIKTLVKYYDGEFIPGPYGDIAVGQSLVDENALMKHSLENEVKYHFGHTYDKLGSRGVHNFSFSQAARYTEQDARFAWLIWTRRILPYLQDNPQLWKYHEAVEQRLYGVLMRKEYRGIDIDTAKVEKLRPVYAQKMNEAVDRLIVDYGAPPDFNPNANVQISELIYKKYKALVVKRTEKTKAPSTDAETLQRISNSIDVEGNPTPAAEVASVLLDYAENQKMLGTYIIGMGSRLDHAGRLHPNFLQYSTDTGRLSCREPNVHNIPRDSDMREMFIAPPGYVVIAVDYDQIELRFIGMYADDPTLQEIFRSGADVHAGTAAAVLRTDIADVDADRRNRYGKMPNFMLGYGGTAYGLAGKLNIPVEHAEKVLADYYRAFSRIMPWKNRELRAARARAEYAQVNGDRHLIVPPYVETQLGRRRRLPFLLINPSRAKSKEEWIRLKSMLRHAERQAINAIIQGTAADVIKVAMIDLQSFIDTDGFPLQLVMNIHDELVAIAPERHGEEAREIMESIMSDVINPFTREPFLRGWCDLVTSGVVDDHWRKAS
jgi:DNA polymerase I